jgi:hypothetical protein
MFQMATAFSLQQTVRNTKASGATTHITEKAKKRGRMAVNLSVNLLKVKRTALEFTSGLMAPSIQANGSTIR